MNATKAKPKMGRVWRAYKRSGDCALRNRLMEVYMPLVRYSAERVRTKLPDEVEYDDLVSAGTFGLMDAIDSFDLQRGVKFETYCAPRIRGAILDELRSMDWVPRLVRSRGTQLERAQRELEAILGRAPHQAEIAERFGLPMDEYEKLVRDAKAVAQISLARRHGQRDSAREACEIDFVEDRKAGDPYLEAQRRDLRELVTRGLTRSERLILTLYYYEELTMKEIGTVLDLSESRVSQMHSCIMIRLREQLQAQQRELVMN